MTAPSTGSRGRPSAGGINLRMRVARGFRRATPRLKVGVALMIVLVLVAVSEPFINEMRLGGRSPTDLALFDRGQSMSLRHPLGTDGFGRDMLSLLLVGLRFSLFVGLLSGALATGVAVFVALFGGYSGGRTDGALTLVTTATLIVPVLPILMAVAAFARLDLTLMAVVLAFFSWPLAARIIRVQVLSLRERPYVQFARLSGFGRMRIIFAEILPNLAPFVFVGFAYAVIQNIFAETGLRLVGLGPGEVVSLGSLLNNAMAVGALARGEYPMVLAPVSTLVLIFVALSLISVGLEERFNPRLKGVTGA
jgi:peptide/nickel transport system permease protein